MTNGNGRGNGNGNGNGTTDDAMDVDGANGGEGIANGGAKGKQHKRKYFVGDEGVGVWRPGMEVDNFMVDGVGKSHSFSASHHDVLCAEWETR